MLGQESAHWVDSILIMVWVDVWHLIDSWELFVDNCGLVENLEILVKDKKIIWKKLQRREIVEKINLNKKKISTNNFLENRILKYPCYKMEISEELQQEIQE